MYESFDLALGMLPCVYRPRLKSVRGKEGARGWVGRAGAVVRDAAWKRGRSDVRMWGQGSDVGMWGQVELPYYAWKRDRKDMAVSSTACILGCLCCYYALYQLNPVGTFWVFLMPTLLGSFFLMFGNWSQHIFVDPRKPECNYHLTYNVINTPNNQTSFNDGYHIEHHLSSRRHWTELPEAFNEKLDKYAEEEALVFDGLDFMAVGFLTFTGNYRVLTDKLVQIKEPRMTPAEAEAMLRARLVPIHRDADGKQKGA